MKHFALLVPVLFGLVAAPAWAAHGATQEEDYVGAHAWSFGACSLARYPDAIAHDVPAASPEVRDVLALGVAAVDEHDASGCFTVPAGHVRATVTIEDALRFAVGGFYWFRDANGLSTTGDFFCGSTGVMALPSGTAEVEVFVQSPASGVTPCLADGVVTTAAPTTGVIRVTTS